MPDVVDDSQVLIQKSLDDSLKKRTLLRLPFSGFCLACSEPVVERRFCNANCREHFETSLRRRRMISGSIR